jgi:hypothetical protein
MESGNLRCARGHRYPIVIGIPVFLLAEKVGIPEEEKRGIERDWIAGGKIDPANSYRIGAT